MSITLNQGLNQDATYWSRATPNGQGGYAYGTPAPIKVRWEEVIAEIKLQNGEIFISNATVFVPQDVELNGYLYLGTSVETNPSSLSGAAKIQMFRKLPSINGEIFERRAYL